MDVNDRQLNEACGWLSCSLAIKAPGLLLGEAAAAEAGGYTDVAAGLRHIAAISDRAMA